MISYCASLDEPKKILFVSEKRAAIDAVLKRLNEKNLDFLILDVFEGLKAQNKKKIYQEISNLIEKGVETFDNRSLRKLDKDLVETRNILNAFTNDSGINNFKELENFLEEGKNNFLEGHQELSELLINIDNQEIQDMIEKISLENISQFTSENIQLIIGSILNRSKILEGKTLDIEF